MYPVLKESFRDMSWVFRTVFGHITSDVAASNEITQEEFIEMINRIAIKRGIAFIFENSVLSSCYELSSAQKCTEESSALRNVLTTANLIFHVYLKVRQRSILCGRRASLPSSWNYPEDRQTGRSKTSIMSY